MNELLALPREWIAATAEIASFMSTVVRDVWGLRVLRFFGEALRQAGILIVGSTLVIWGLVFVTGLGTCGIEGAYFLESQGAPSYAGVFTALCDLREAVPYAFGYMMSAKVGTGIVGRTGYIRQNPTASTKARACSMVRMGLPSRRHLSRRSCCRS